jgi:LuxR family transcriptional regulator, maltose regulon positive regulatory protein
LAAAAAGRDTLLATKLHVPGSRPGMVSRPRLAEALDEGLNRGLVLVCAPAGYGKTALLADWARRGRRPVGWLSLDSGDNDPARFWRHAVAALDRTCPGISERVATLLGPPAPPSFDPLLTALVNELADQPRADEVLLVLDDYHLISSPLVHESLGFLIEHRPPVLRLVLTSRSDPPLALARLRASGQLAELRAAELRFTAVEAASMLRDAASAELPDVTVAALAERTEGWAAGLQLAGLSLHGQQDVAGFVAAFTGTHRYILDYLAEEVLEHQGEQVHEFLLATSVLERLSGDLCDAVTGRTGSQALLEQVESANLFLVPLDEERSWWRYHHLFADLLRARLQQEQPERVRQLHRNAATWYQEHGLADDAIRHAMAAGDLTWAAQLIEQHFDEVFFLRGEAATIHRWLSALPSELVWSRSRLLLAEALMEGTSGRVEVVESLLDAAERVSPDTAQEPFEPTARRGASMLINVPALIALHRSQLAQLHGDTEAAAALASAALAESRAEEWLLTSSAQGHLAMAEWLRGRLKEAEDRFESIVAGRRAAGQPTMTAFGCYQLGQIQRAQGHLDTAVQTYQQALEAIAVPGQPPLPAAGPAYIGLAEVAYQQNELDAALQHVSAGIALCRRFVYTEALAAGLVTLAWLRQATGDLAGALAAMNEAEQASPRLAGLSNFVPAQRARLLLAQDDLAGAARWVDDQGLTTDDHPYYPGEPGHLVLARVLLAQGRPGLALTLLDRLYASAAAQDRTGSLIEIGALRALALVASDQETDAVDALAGALASACPQGYIRVFADEGPPMAALLGRLIAAQRAEHAAAAVPLGCLARIQRALAPEQATPARERGSAAGLPGLVEPLTPRELEVLGMLAAGRSNQVIAAELVVTLDTVKKHVSHVLGKLGAANRTEAVARARELELIP